jgi:hypothetical protein
MQEVAPGGLVELFLVSLGFVDPGLRFMFGQAHHRSMPFFDHLLQVRRVTVTELFDRINADAFKHLLVVGADSLELVEVVRYVFRHLATPVLYRRSAAYRRILETPQTQARVPRLFRQGRELRALTWSQVDRFAGKPAPDNCSASCCRVAGADLRPLARPVDTPPDRFGPPRPDVVVSALVFSLFAD